MKSGVELISEERNRQVTEEGWTSEHDEQHVCGELAMVAACYASRYKLYIKYESGKSTTFLDPWPADWYSGYDKRLEYGSRIIGKDVPDPATYTDDQRMDLLVKAGALIAAEIDRIKRRG